MSRRKKEPPAALETSPAEDQGPAGPPAAPPDYCHICVSGHCRAGIGVIGCASSQLDEYPPLCFNCENFECDGRQVEVGACARAQAGLEPKKEEVAA